MKYCLTVAAVYLAFVSVYVAWCFARVAYHAWKLEREKIAQNRRATEYIRMIRALRREHREAELCGVGEVDYREYGED